MDPERAFRGTGGLFIMLSAALTWLVSPWFVILTGFIGFMLFQSSVTGACPGLWFMRKLFGR